MDFKECFVKNKLQTKIVHLSLYVEGFNHLPADVHMIDCAVSPAGVHTVFCSASPNQTHAFSA